MLRRNRRDADEFAMAMESKAEQAMPELSAKVRGSLAMSLLRQASLLSAQRVKSYESVVGSKGKVGLMAALASLADSASKVFQWSQETSQPMIINGSFVQIHQAQATPSCGVVAPTSGVQPNQVIDVTPQAQQSPVNIDDSASTNEV